MALQEELEKQGSWLFRYRSYLPLVFVLAGAIVYATSADAYIGRISANASAHFFYQLACLMAGLLGLGIRIYAVGFSPRNTSGRNTTEQLAEELNTKGIYSIVRHPLYLGNFFMYLAPALLTANGWFILCFCLAFWVYYERIMFAEEQFLRRKFGEAYTSWAAATPAFIPRFSQFNRSNLSFSWKKVVKKEKNGLLALLLIFAAFNLWDAYKAGWYFTCHEQFFIAAGALMLPVYLVLKYIKHKTHLLDEEGR